MYIVEAILPLAHRKSQLKNRALCGQKKKNPLQLEGWHCLNWKEDSIHQKYSSSATAD